MLRTLHTPEIHEGIVRLSPLDQPSIPIVAPFATLLESRWQARTASLVIATAIIFVAVEVPTGVPWELAGATIFEYPLSSARNLQIETVISSNIVAYVCDLHNHALARQVRM